MDFDGQDNVLLEAVTKYNAKNWKQIGTDLTSFILAFSFLLVVFKVDGNHKTFI